MQNEVGRLRRKFREGRAALFSSAARTAPCGELLEGHAQLVDSLIEEIYASSCHFADKQATRQAQSSLAIVATGGYGRRELNPFSDIDIAFIPCEEEDPWVEAAVHMAFKLVMDVFLSFREVHVGYAYRPVPEISTWDVSTLTALLDARHLCGNRELSVNLESQLRKALSPLDLYLETRPNPGAERGVPGPSLYAIEPNLKQGPGSLRDLHRGRWIFKLLLDVGDADLFPELQKRGVLPAEEVARIRAATEWFWRARNWLHLVTGKHSDVLMNNYQDRIARELEDTTAQEWLSRHYAHAEVLTMFCDLAGRTALEGPLDIGGVRLVNGYWCLPVRDGARDFGASVELFHASQRSGIPVNLQDMKALEARRNEAVCVTEASSEEAWAFLRILGEPREVAPTLRRLLRAGLMDRLIGGFTETMRFVPPDPAHRYTVGEHSMKIIERLEDLRNGYDAGGQRFRELLSHCPHFDVLCLAALIHDAGKLLPGRDHAEAVVGLMRTVADRLGLAPEKKEMLEIVVRHHLLLVRTARLQDLKSAGVIQSVVDKVPGVDALRHLYVFTYVDTRAVAEKNWTAMDYRDLEDLYKKVQEALSGPPAAGKVEDKIGQIRRRLAASHHLDEQAVLSHCDAMPAGYVLNTPLDEITFHVQLLNRLDSERVVLDVYNRPGDDYSELTVCTYDEPQPGLLAKITGVLYGCTVDIAKAQVFTMEKDKPVVLDTLWIRSEGLQISENRARRIRTALKEVLTGARNIEQFLRSLGKHPPVGIPLDSIDLLNNLSEEHTVVHVVARDLQGLLYLMTRALSRAGLHIHSAKVATWTGRAENNFYVTTLTGGQIPAEELPHWKTRLTRMFEGTEPD